MDEKRLTAGKRGSALLLCSGVFWLVYTLSAAHTATIARVSSFVFPFERHIPFLPASILLYLTSSLFFCAVFLLVKTGAELSVLAKRFLFIMLIAGGSYWLLPLKFSFPKPEVHNPVLGALFRFLETFDSPYNQLPSLHVAFAFLFWTVCRQLSAGWRRVTGLLLLLLVLSTLTTYQHHFTDVVAGAVLAYIGFLVFPAPKNMPLWRNHRIANVYFLGGWLIGFAALLSGQFYFLPAFILGWIALVVFAIGLHYERNHVHFLKAKNGTIPFYKKIFYAPYRLLYFAFWKGLKKNTAPVAFLPNLFISPKLHRAQVHQFAPDKNTFVYDLSAELEEDPILKKNACYCCIPFLDIGAFERQETQKLVARIAAAYSALPPGGKVLIHCTMGFTRSAAIAILVTQKVLSLPLPQAIRLVTTANKGTVIHAHLHHFLKTIDL